MKFFVNQTINLGFSRNLNAALWAYYEYDSPELKNIPSMKFVCDVTIGEGESVTPNTNFVKKWRVRNSGIFILFDF